MQDIFRFCSLEQKTKIANYSSPFILDLSKNPFGNYVVQNMIHYGNQGIRVNVLNVLLPHLSTIACHKSGSNILEKIVSKCSPDLKEKVMNGIIENGSILKKIIRDQYGNYVIQKMLRCLPHQQKQILIQALHTHFSTVKDEKIHVHEKHVINQINKFVKN